MKKFVFLLAMVFAISALMAGISRTIAVADEVNINAAKNASRQIFYTEDFESGATGWTHYDGAVSPNMWHIYNAGGTQGNVWWMGDENGNGGYHNHQYLVLDTPVIPISTGNSTLTFKMKHGLEPPGASGGYDGWDSFNIRISTNSGITYTVIPDTTAIVSPVYDFNNSYAFGSEHGEGMGVSGWGGVRDWTTVTVNLSSYLVSGSASVKIRFAFASDPAYCTDDEPALFGVMVDDIALAGYTNTGEEDNMTYSSLVPTAGDFWHIATDANAPSPTHIMSSMNNAGTYVPNMMNYVESPDITLPTGATQIIADFQLKGSYDDAGVFPDVDYFGWEVYHNGAWYYMSNPYADPNGSNYVFSSAPETWASMILSYTGVTGDITNFSGSTVRFRWYFQSNDNTPIGTPLQIDNFQIFSVTAAPAAPNLVYPANGQQNLPFTGFDLDWAANSQGALPESYNVYMDTELENLELSSFNPTYAAEGITVSYYNPVANNLVTFSPSETWYWRVGAYVEGQEEALSEIFTFHIIASAINTFPWTENFEHSGAMPTGWTIGNVDNDATTWAIYGPTTTYSHSPSYSVRHNFSAETADPGQNGWLITPAIQLPSTGAGALTFWSRNPYAPYTVYNGVLVNTDPSPTNPNWVEIWAQDDLTTTAWAQKTVNLSDYAGNIIYIAFKYTGYDANAWYIDDVTVNFYTDDVLPPVFSNHLPIINTLRDDLPFPVTINVVDDAIFNNPIMGVNLYYSTNSGTTWSAPIAMTPPTTGNTYTGEIPAVFSVGDEVTYKFETWDDHNNYATKQFSFEINDPVWIYYDMTGPTSYNGSTSIVWGPMVYYENPLYGTFQTLQLLSVSGITYTATNATLYIYGEDSEGNISVLYGPSTINFPTARTWTTFDLSAYGIQIDTPYFWIAFGNMTSCSYYALDQTYDYTPYAYIMNQGTPFYYFTGLTGEWCIDAYVQSGELLIPETAANISAVTGNPVISWNALSPAASYDVYGSNDPYAEFPTNWVLLADNITTTSFEYTGTEAKKFFKVVASTNLTGSKGRSVPQGSLKASKVSFDAEGANPNRH
ncbi:MAG: choice-of-anchor J domain-containing protein [Candidatus Cloacimonas sp.]